MESLKLGVLGLSTPEQSLVATLFRLHRVDPSFIWTLTSKPPFDALLVDAGMAPRSYVQSVGPRTQLKRLSAPGVSAEAGEMPRPIRSDLLVGWLSAIESGLLQEARQVAPAVALPDRSSVVAVAPAPDARPIVKRPGELEASQTAQLPNDQTRFRLKRWPNAGVLARDVGRIRMATLLSRKVMSLNELTMLSRLPASACMHFLRELETQGLLETTEPSVHQPLAARKHAHQADLHPQARSRPGVAASLIHSIRRRFGIG